MSFAAATAVDRTGPATWRGEVEPDWDIFGIANGGYLMSMAARAMSQSAEGRVPASVTAHFTKPVAAGPVIIEVTTVKTGRSFTTLRAEMLGVDGATLVSLIGSFADQGRPIPDVYLSSTQPPDLPPPEECVLAIPSKDRPFPPPIMGQFEERIHPDDTGMVEGKATGNALVRGWFRLLDGEPADPFLPLLVADAFPPAIFNANLPLSWTPTVEMTTQVRSAPEDGWLACQFRTRFISGGLLEEDGEIWDAAGRLVALSRQLALVPR
ncbi:MAG: thioesterase family protein [Acidimicrobiia bacterium]